MAIQQTKRQSDLEKRLSLLRRQVYGSARSTDQKISVSVSTNPRTDTQKSDITYLHQDLLKISLMASAALGIQIILFVLSKNHIFNLNLF